MFEAQKQSNHSIVGKSGHASQVLTFMFYHVQLTAVSVYKFMHTFLHPYHGHTLTAHTIRIRIQRQPVRAVTFSALGEPRFNMLNCDV